MDVSGALHTSARQHQCEGCSGTLWVAHSPRSPALGSSLLQTPTWTWRPISGPGHCSGRFSKCYWLKNNDFLKGNVCLCMYACMYVYCMSLAKKMSLLKENCFKRCALWKATCCWLAKWRVPLVSLQIFNPWLQVILATQWARGNPSPSLNRTSQSVC